MFQRCSNLTNIDFSNLDTKNVTDMSKMFLDCTSIKILIYLVWILKMLQIWVLMFLGCGALTNIDLSNLNTQNVTNMSDMFRLCRSLTSIDLSNFDTKNVVNMKDMLSFCNSLTNINLKNLNTQNVTTMETMFGHCTSLTS